MLHRLELPKVLCASCAVVPACVAPPLVSFLMQQPFGLALCYVWLPVSTHAYKTTQCMSALDNADRNVCHL